MHWLMLSIGIVMEIAGTTCLKLSDGLTKLVPSVLIFVFYGLSFAAAAYAMKRLDIGFVYAVWAGLGILLIGVIGIVYFKESVSALRIVSMLLIAVGVIGLNLSGASTE